MAEYTTEQLNVLKGATKTVKNHLEIVDKINKMPVYSLGEFIGDLFEKAHRGDIAENSAIAFYRYCLIHQQTEEFLTEYWSMVYRIIDASNPDKELVNTLTTDDGKISLIEKICSVALKHSTTLTTALNTLVQYRAEGNKDAKELVKKVYERFPKLKPENSQ